jgi:ubiquinone/menaquinone biosynthesis C-methylase UbiE
MGRQDRLRGVSVSAGEAPTMPQMDELFRQKHGSPENTGWAPGRRHKFGYYVPSDVYEGVVASEVKKGFAWLDIGGGHAIFPDNLNLARELAARCSRLVVVDPSDNVARNALAHEVARCTLEEYKSTETFDIATMRMVVEHVEHPKDFVGALARLIRPGGVAVVFTVNRRSPVTMLSHAVPFRFHHLVKRVFWGGEEEDTFPTCYLMNSRKALVELFESAGFVEKTFIAVDDLSVFSRFRSLNLFELALWRFVRSMGLSYPENCLLGVYVRTNRPVTPVG